MLKDFDQDVIPGCKTETCGFVGNHRQDVLDVFCSAAPPAPLGRR